MDFNTPRPLRRGGGEGRRSDRGALREEGKTGQKIAVVGAGTMGRGIAQVAVTQGIPTHLCDLNEVVLDEARQAMARGIDKGIEKGKIPPEARGRLAELLVTGTDVGAAVAGADLVIEAVPESLELKLGVLRTISTSAPSGCVLASNTSSLPITGLAAGVPAPSRFLGMHFFNPVPVMKLVEVVRGLETSEETVEAAVALARRLGKEPIVVNDSPGFATSRLGVAIGLEAIRMVESGVAGADEIDRAMEIGYRHPMGPLRLTDLVGLDVRLAIAEHLQKELGERFRPPALLRKMVRAGRLGKKSGRGFYDWDDD
ncbi:MAG: 3-hydroxyacyl-CoA dehydrogenase family protein [Planctomycetota bacterium]